MPPSVDSSTCTPSACLTRSTPRKRNSRYSKVLTDDLRKKSRGSTSLSETSPRRSDNLDLIGQLTQESQKKRSNPDNDAYLPSKRPQQARQQGNFPLTQKDDDFLKRGPLEKGKRLASEYPTDGSVRSMILHLASLTRSILVAYEKERNQENCGVSAITTELAQQRTLNEAVASELARLRTFHEAATLELSHLRISNEAAAGDIANLQLENANLVKKEAAASLKLDEFRRQRVIRDAVNILAAFVMSKALVFKEQVELDTAGKYSEIDKLRFENAQALQETRDSEEKKEMQILNLQSSLAAAAQVIQETRYSKEKKELQILNLQSSLAATERKFTQLSSEKDALMKGKEEAESKTSLATQDMLCRLEAANEEVKQIRLSTEELLREKEEVVAKADKAAGLELEKIECLNEKLRSEMHTAKEIAGAEIRRLKSSLESTARSLKNIILEKEEMATEKEETESRTKMEITQLQSEKAALVAERERTCVTANHEFERLRSRLENAVQRLETVQHTSGMEKAKLQSEINAKSAQLQRVFEVQANAVTREAQRAAEADRLRREKEEGHAREAALLEKLEAALPRPHAEMHLAFLINCGLRRPEDAGLNFMPLGRSC